MTSAARGPSASGPTHLADNPIHRPEEDVLQRLGQAEAFADQVRRLDASDGMVVAVLGPWGSGKTSFVNLARPRLAASCSAVLEFNPWMFSGAEQLVNSFFVELGAQLRVRKDLKAVGDQLADYGEAFSGLGWLPVAGPWIERGRMAASVLGKILRRRQEGVAGRRERLRSGLAALDRPIVVVLDDVDRLTTAEIRDVFRLVRLTASFPNLLYVLAFDRARVEAALGEDGLPGRAYLEKIVQLAVDLPVIPVPVLDRQVSEALDAAIAGTRYRFDEQVWPDVYVEVVRPLLQSMRDVKRYSFAVQGAVAALGDGVALVDLLALEAVRVFMPDVFARLPAAVSALTTTSSVGQQEDPVVGQQVIGLVDTAGENGPVVRALVERLFPAATRHLGGTRYSDSFKQTWLRGRRVAHEDILSLFLEKIAGEGVLNLGVAERAFGLLRDVNAFNELLRATAPDQLEDVITALENFESDYQPEHVVPGCTVLLNLLPDMPDRPRGMFDFGKELVVGRVVYRLVRSLQDAAAIEEAVSEILPQVTTLGAKRELIDDVGYRENVGHKLVSEGAAARCERQWRDEVRAAPVSVLAKDQRLLRVVLRMMQEVEAPEPAFELANDADLTLQLLRAGRSEVRSQGVGTRAVRRSERLGWDVLSQVVGGEETLKARLSAIRRTDLGASDEGLLKLADRYAEGWRPDD